MNDRDPSQVPLEPQTVYLGVGANLGDRRRQIEAALERLAGVPGVSVDAVSSLVESAPVGGPPQGDYLNGAAQLTCSLSPRTLLEICKQLERDAGRESNGVRNAPRPLDLDVLLFGDWRIEAPGLRVPHPRFTEREFVLGPLRELGLPAGDPDWIAARQPAASPLQFRQPADFAAWCARQRSSGARLGLVPTMGALHAGHVSLLERARGDCDVVVATIFVNPLQFGVGEDLDSYPRTFEADLQACRLAGVDAVFAPAVDAMYPDGFCSEVAVGVEAEGLEGGQRAGHFSGVATVVTRLWSLALPHAAYFGQKDAQQVAVLRRLHQDLGLCGALIECPIVRESDGLAMSSRNVYLNAADRAAAPVLHRALQAATAAFARGEARQQTLRELVAGMLDAEPRADVDYLEFRDSKFRVLEEERDVHAGDRLLVAARFGSEPQTRLLDNIVFEAKADPGGVR